MTKRANARKDRNVVTFPGKASSGDRPRGDPRMRDRCHEGKEKTVRNLLPALCRPAQASP
jgi:hypothetical protein